MIIITVVASIWLSGARPRSPAWRSAERHAARFGVGNVHGMSVPEPLLVRVHPAVAVT